MERQLIFGGLSILFLINGFLFQYFWKKNKKGKNSTIFKTISITSFFACLALIPFAKDSN
jgi:hypothetical protein